MRNLVLAITAITLVSCQQPTKEVEESKKIELSAEQIAEANKRQDSIVKYENELAKEIEAARQAKLAEDRAKAEKQKIKLAGVYEIVAPDYRGTDQEAYALSKDGKAVWGWINGSSVNTLKSGSWSIENGNIVVRINGNSGVIESIYELKNGKYKDNWSGHYLKFVKKYKA